MAILFFRYFVRALLWLRYRITVHGVENLRGLRGPALVCPNHPGLIDPVMIMGYIGGEIPLRPLVTSIMYRRTLLYPIMKFIGALEVPDLEKQSQSAREKTQVVIDHVVSGLDAGSIFLIYPAGRLERRHGREVLGGTRAVPDILQQRPNTKLVLVRTTGVWGSISTFAPTGTDPDLEKAFIKTLLALITNFFFFLPRRKISITIEVVETSQLPGLSREVLNPWLEHWYNKGLISDPIFVPYHFYFGPRTFEFPKIAAALDVPLDKITDATKQAVAEILAEKLKRPLTEEEKTPDFVLDVLGLDSLDRMDIALTIEQRFGFRSDAVASTVGQLWALAQGLAQHAPQKPIQIPASWTALRETEDGPLIALGDTIPEAFVRRALAHRKEAIVADDLSGVVTYERLLIGARLMAKRFAEFPGEAVGVMLPASVAADTVTMALMLAGKLPVMLNWTTGPANLAHAVKTMGIQRVVSSQKFLDRAGVSLDRVEFFFLEDFRKNLSKLEVVVMLLRTRFFGAGMRARLPKLDPNQPAVVLFTSGSEKAPKAVPLTHRNILYDVQAGAKALGFNRKDILLGFLPPFHSFGLSGNIILPLVTGLRVVHHADPTDASGLVRKIAAYKPSLLLTTPTFFSYILSAGKPADLTSLRLVITGAEKCPDALFDRAGYMTPGAVLVEGYGITECSPVVSVNRPQAIRRGTIGQPLEGVELKVIDVETHAPLPLGEMGLLLVQGPTIFPGYLHHDGPSPFVEIDGKQWYNTGDLARLDAENYITFLGRLKRFLKAGGEMISLPALEEPLAGAHPADENGPRVAVEGIETPTGRLIIAFTTTDLTLPQANALLAQAGMRGIMRLDEVRRVEKIPVLGTGKTDYKVLRAEIKG